MSTPKFYVLGPAGTNGQECLNHWMRHTPFPKGGAPEIELVKGTNTDVIAKVNDGEVGSYGIVPVENGSEGFVLPVLRYWLEHEKELNDQRGQPRLRVIAEQTIPVAHHLIVHVSKESIKEIDFILSHPQALGQCDKGISKFKLPDGTSRFPQEKRRPTNSTADAVRQVSANPHCAALASEFAQKQYQSTKIIKWNLQDSPYNATRFHVIQKVAQNPKPAENNRTAILFTLKNVPGALNRVTWILKSSNMSAITSIHLGKLSQYAFYVEFDTHAHVERGASMLYDLRRRACSKLLVLGSYPQEVL